MYKIQGDTSFNLKILVSCYNDCFPGDCIAIKVSEIRVNVLLAN